MGAEIRPEPTPEEREAILRACAELQEKPGESEWWRAGLIDAVDEEQGQA